MLREADELAQVCRTRFLLLAAASSSGSGPGPAGFIASFGIVVAGTLRDMLAASTASVVLKTSSDVADITYCSFMLASGSWRETPLFLNMSFRCCSNACPDGSLTATHDLNCDSHRATPLFFLALSAVWLLSRLIFCLAEQGARQYVPKEHSNQGTRSLEYESNSCSPSPSEPSYWVGNHLEIVCISGQPANDSDFRASRVDLAEQSILRGPKLNALADCD